jgi:hypothetical protein
MVFEGAGMSQRRRVAHRRGAWLAVAVLVLATASACSPRPPGPGPTPPGTPAPAPRLTSTISPLVQGGFVAGWDGAHRRLALNRKGSDGRFDGYWAAEDGSHPTCLTCTLPDAEPTQRSIADVFPGGDHVVLTVEKSRHPGSIGASWAEPGKGLDNDLWIARSDGRGAWPVAEVPADGNHGIIWPRLDGAGRQLVWAEMYGGVQLFTPKQQLGVWRLKLADVAWTDGVPRLEHVRTYEPEPGNFYEPYGFSPDGRQILFASSAGMQGVSDSQIYRVSTDLTGLTRLSDQNEPGWANYNEFAFYLPDGAHIVYARTKESTSGGLDYWVMGADGSNPYRLTFLNEPNHPQARGYSNVGGWAFDPRDPDHFLFGSCHDLTCETSDVLSLHLRANGDPLPPG